MPANMAPFGFHPDIAQCLFAGAGQLDAKPKCKIFGTVWRIYFLIVIMSIPATNIGERLQEAAAQLLSELRDGCKTSQKAIGVLTTGVNSLIKIYVDVLKDKFHRELSALNGYITLAKISSVLEAFQDQSIFQGLEKCSDVESHLREKSQGKEVILKQAVMQSKIVIRKGIPRKVPTKFGYTVPFLPQLEQLLNCPDVLECVENPLPTQEGVYRTVTDGLFYRYHPVVCEHGPKTLAIIIHVDDADICDALKSKSGKNNLRLFYWSLGNIHPSKRSSLKAINLLAISLAKVAKEKGNEFLLHDFIQDIRKLGSDGVELEINGQVRRFYGVLLFAACDNPAAANLGKFKETHFANRPCRICMVKRSDMCELFREDPLLLRKKYEHEEHVNRVMALKNQGCGGEVEVINIFKDVLENEEDDGHVTESLYQDHENPSVNYGVNGRSILSQAPHFDVTKCLPQDIMHLLNEGVVETVCRLILKDLCLPSAPRAKPLISLEHLNKCIDTLFDLGHLTASKPSVIERGHLKGSKLKQSASQMLVLLRLLPFIVHNRCPKEKLQLILKLIQLVDLCMSFEISDTDIDKLRTLVEEFGNDFRLLYPAKKTLKLHCIIHLATQIRLHGPLRQQWCFRFEAMHSKFTNIFPVVRSMKNPALTSAVRHLAARNAELCRSNYLTENDGLYGCKDVCIADLPERDCLLQIFPDLGDTLSKAEQFHHRGSKWHEGVILLLNSEENSFGRVQAVYVLESEVYFTYNCLKTEYIASYHASEICSCEEEFKIISFGEVKHKFPLWRVSFKFLRNLKSFIIMQSPIDTY